MPLDQAPPALLRLAEWLADPAGWDRGDDSLPPDLRDAMAESVVLRPLLNDWLAERRGLRSLDLDAGLGAGLEQQGDLRLAVALLTADEGVLEDAARFLGAALWSERLRRTVLRSDRERLTELLGEEAMAFALRRAPLLAKPLTEVPGALDAADPLVAGRALCAALVARGHADLATLFRLRLPEAPGSFALSDRQAQAARAVLSLRGIAA